MNTEKEPSNNKLPEDIIEILDKLTLDDIDHVFTVLERILVNFIQSKLYKLPIASDELWHQFVILFDMIQPTKVEILFKYLRITLDNEFAELIDQNYQVIYWNIVGLKKDFIQTGLNDDRGPALASTDPLIFEPSMSEVQELMAAARHKLNREIHGTPLQPANDTSNNNFGKLGMPLWIEEKSNKIENGEVLTKGTIIRHSGRGFLKIKDGKSWESNFIFGRFEHGTRVRVIKMPFGFKVEIVK